MHLLIQSAGSIPFDFDGLGLRFAAMPGHKGLLGPQGTGVLLCSEPVQPFITGGTGSESLLMTMPEYLPDRLEGSERKRRRKSCAMNRG